MLGVLGAVFGASIMGSLHCAGMCGPFVAFYSGQAKGRTAGAAHLAYSAGRLTTYALLGAVAGFIGQALDVLGAAAGLQRTAAILAGSTMIAWGLIALARELGLRLPHLAIGRGLSKPIHRAVRKLQGHSPVLRGLVLGLLTTLLPCGWLYAFVITAAATGSALSGAAVMVAFWAGTLPVLLGMGVSLQWLAGPLRRHVPAATAVVLVCLGVFAVSGRAALPTERVLQRALEASPTAAETTVETAAKPLGTDGLPSAAETVPNAGHQPACCHEEK